MSNRSRWIFFQRRVDFRCMSCWIVLAFVWINELSTVFFNDILVITWSSEL
jgi:hypothetical protein